MTYSNIEELGWSPSLAEAFAAEARAEQIPGRVVRVDGACATAWTRSGELRVDLPSRLRKGESTLVVGDWVAIEVGEGGSAARAVRVLPRQTHLARRAAGRRVRRQLLAANIDVVFIVSAMDAEFNERRLERYLTIVNEGGARSVLLLTKAGLTNDPESFVERARKIAPGVDVHGIDVVAGIGGERPRIYLERGCTAVLVGSSGVGKSTLLNHLAGENLMATHGVRGGDGQGQHTTKHRELFLLSEGGVVIDTPGLRELALWADTSSLDQAFSDVEGLARECRFGDCSHRHEPGCAVREAVEAGELEEGRLRAYLDLREEIATTEVQMPVHERRKRDRQQGRLYRQVQVQKRGRR